MSNTDNPLDMGCFECGGDGRLNVAGFCSDQCAAAAFTRSLDAIPGATITDAQIRALALDSDPLTKEGQRAIAAASTALYVGASREQFISARAICAEILAARSGSN